jgi:hypothetical protein
VTSLVTARWVEHPTAIFAAKIKADSIRERMIVASSLLLRRIAKAVPEKK